jgi:hypothetical protein
VLGGALDNEELDLLEWKREAAICAPYRPQALGRHAGRELMKKTECLITPRSLSLFQLESFLILILLFALPISISQARAAESASYFDCRGKTGLSKEQKSIGLEARTITAAESEVRGSMRLSRSAVTVESIPFVSDTYKICQTTDQTLWFSPSGSAEFCAGNDKFNDLGTFNKITGIFRYHAGEFLAILECKLADRLTN